MIIGDIMNRKGFTLIELLAVIVLLSIIMIITVPSVVEYVKTSRNASYAIFIKSIISASKTYYEECEYGDLSDSSKYKSYACQINGNKIETTLSALANTGMLTVKDVDPDDNNKKIVLNPKDNTEDISSCNVTIVKTVDSNYKVTYEITSTNCPDINGSIN